MEAWIDLIVVRVDAGMVIEHCTLLIKWHICSSHALFDSGERLRFESHWPTVCSLGFRHSCILEAWCNVISLANRVGYHEVTLAVARLSLLGEHRGCDEWLFRLVLFINCLLFVDFIEIIGLGDQAIVLVVFQYHTPCSKHRNEDQI